MAIRTKLLMCLSALGLIVAVLSVAAFVSIRSGNAALETLLRDRIVPMRDLKIVADKYAIDIVDASHKARNGNITFADAARRVERGSELLHRHWAQYRATYITGDEAALAQVAQDHMRIADARVARLRTILSRGDRAALDAFVLHDLYQGIDPVSAAIGKLVDLQIHVADQTSAAAMRTARIGRDVMIGLMLVAALVVLASLVTVTRQVIAPIKRLALTIRGLAANVDSAVPHLDQRDEIGDIARAVDTFRQAVVDAEQEKARAAADATATLADSLAALAAGDLTCKIDGAFPESYAKLRSDFNNAVDELGTTIGAVARSTVQIKSGAGEVSQASDHLSQRTEQQAASLEESSAAMAEITDVVRNTALDADRASAVVSAAREDAQRSGAIVQKTVDAISRIEQASGEIGEIISVIDGIAFQTNLLALNAGVEAARAGDAGKGFAVVASEVRALAQRSADAAKDVKTRITASAIQVEAGVALVGETGESLDRIITRVEEIAVLVQAIAKAASSQSDGLQQINIAVSEMDGVTQQNAAMVEEANAAARCLAQEADGLAEQVKRFRLGSSAIADAPVARLPRPAARHAAPARRGNLALAADADWSSF